MLTIESIRLPIPYIPNYDVGQKKNNKSRRMNTQR